MVINEAPAVQEIPLEPRTQSPRVRLTYLDGLRGLAALNVVITHAIYQAGWHGRPGTWQEAVSSFLWWISQGRSAVAIFIVLSGYCLMLPVARSSHGLLRGGTASYLMRRAKRILPPYYAALGISLLLLLLIPGLRQPINPEWENALPAWTLEAILPHLLLLHNLNSSWMLKINPPLWTVATEWQIYFVFPALLLPIWRRAGNAAAVAAGFAVGLAPVLLLQRERIGAAPWFVGLFALGMAAACVSFPRRERERIWRDHIPWGTAAVVLFGVFAVLQALPFLPAFDALTQGKPLWLWPYLWAVDTIIGAATFSLLIYCTRSLTLPEHLGLPLIVRLLDAPFPVWLGQFSYSLYLIHDILLALVYLPLWHLRTSAGINSAVLLFAGVPFALLGSLLFHRIFERRFM